MRGVKSFQSKLGGDGGGGGGGGRVLCTQTPPALRTYEPKPLEPRDPLEQAVPGPVRRPCPTAGSHTLGRSCVHSRWTRAP